MTLLGEYDATPALEDQHDAGCFALRADTDPWECTCRATAAELRVMARYGDAQMIEDAEAEIDRRTQAHAMAMGWDRITPEDRAAAARQDDDDAKARSRARD